MEVIIYSPKKLVNRRIYETIIFCKNLINTKLNTFVKLSLRYKALVTHAYVHIHRRCACGKFKTDRRGLTENIGQDTEPINVNLDLASPPIYKHK